MTEDDLMMVSSISEIPLPLDCWVQEKLDAANVGVSWLDAPILRNRDHVLTKNYSKIKTPAKQQFVPAWNWVHAHEGDIKHVAACLESDVTIYGEWMWAKHSLEYDLLSDWFIAYDIWSVADKKFVAPDVMQILLSETNIKYIMPHKRVFKSVQEILAHAEAPSAYRNGVREGDVFKMAANGFVTDSFKVVNKSFVRRNDFNNVPMERNSLKK